MSRSPKFYYSTDVGAPVLSGTVGSMIALLDAVLVNGYGAKTSLGWTKPFSGTNLAAYRNSPVTGSGMYLRVNDTNAQVSLIVGYETMSSVDTGTDRFPSTVQQPVDPYIAKSLTASAVARPWVICGNSRCFYLFVGTNLTEFGSTATPYFFGDINPYNPTDQYTFSVPIGFPTVTTTPSTTTDLGGVFFNTIGTSATPFVSSGSPRAYIARSYIKYSPQPMALYGPISGSNATIGSSSGFSAYPMGNINGMLLQRVFVGETAFNGVVRGELPGVYGPFCNFSAVPTLTEFNNLTGVPANTTLKLFRFRTSNQSSSNADGSILFDMTNDW